VWFAIGFPAGLVILNAISIATFVFVMIGIPALLILWACSGVWALVASICHVRHRDWSQALISAVLPVVIICAATHFWGFVHFCNDAGDVVHFVAERPSYLRALRATQSNGDPRLAVFNRGGMIWASRGYVYDESDEIIRDESLQTSTWKSRARDTELGCGYFAKPFPGDFSFTHHWYLASFGC
jgi:hypothetical protein